MAELSELTQKRQRGRGRRRRRRKSQKKEKVKDGDEALGRTGISQKDITVLKIILCSILGGNQACFEIVVILFA